MPIQELDQMAMVIDETVSCFESTMKQVFDEDPGLFETKMGGETVIHSTKATWNTQVSTAGDEFHTALSALVEKFENRLHNGEFA
jgi:hypothetical protein